MLDKTGEVWYPCEKKYPEAHMISITGPICLEVRPVYKTDPVPQILQTEDPGVYACVTETLCGGGKGWLAYLNRAVCGVLTVRPCGEQSAEITALYILPEYRGLGAAYCLLERAEGVYAGLRLWLSVGNERAVRFFTRFGFVYSGESRPGDTLPQVQYVYAGKTVGHTRLDVPYIDQREKYPTGCESVSAVMALQYAGAELSVENWIDHHLPKGNGPCEKNGIYSGANPWRAFPGDPYTTDGWGCFAPVIAEAAEKALAGTGFRMVPFYGLSPETLCRLFIARGIPVIFWATLDMAAGRACRPWLMDDGSGLYTWTEPMHCLLLTGFDEKYLYFNDPMRGKDTAYTWEAVRQAYRIMHSQAAVVLPERKAMEYAHSAGAVLYTEREGEIRYLLVREKLGHIGFPKGHLEAGETVFDAAEREIREETGLSADLQTAFRRETVYLLREGTKWKWVTYFTARYAPDAVPARTGEVADFMELPYTEAMEALTYQNTKNLLAEADMWIRKRM